MTAALLFVDRDTDKDHYDQDYGLVFGADDLDARTQPVLQAASFTLTAREVGLCVDSGWKRNKLVPHGCCVNYRRRAWMCVRAAANANLPLHWFRYPDIIVVSSR